MSRARLPRAPFGRPLRGVPGFFCFQISSPKAARRCDRATPRGQGTASRSLASAALAAALLPALQAPATALTLCLRPDPVRSFQTAAESEDAYLVVYGHFTFDTAALPGSGASTPPPSGTLTPLKIPALFSGVGLTRDGFTTALDMAVTLEGICSGPGCGAIEPGIDYLAFLKRGQGGYRAEVSSCVGFLFADPEQAVLDRMGQCLRGEDCDPGF